MRALFWSAVINGIVAVPLIVIVILLSSSGTVTGGYTASLANRVLAWLAAIVMGVAAVLTFVAA